MAVVQQASEAEILGRHRGVAAESPNNKCLAGLFAVIQRGEDSAQILDESLPSDGTHAGPEGSLMVYRECGVTACRTECIMAVNAAGIVEDGGFVGGSWCLNENQRAAGVANNPEAHDGS